MLIKYKCLKTNHMAQKIHLSTLLDIIMMMPLDFYV